MIDGFDVSQLWTIHSDIVGPDVARLSDYDSTTEKLLSILAEMDEHIGTQEVYDSTLDKAVVLARGLAVRLPFETGNWRTALGAVVQWLRLHGIRLTDEGLYLAPVLIMELGTEQTTLSDASLWLSARIVLL